MNIRSLRANKSKTREQYNTVKTVNIRNTTETENTVSTVRTSPTLPVEAHRSMSVLNVIIPGVTACTAISRKVFSMSTGVP